MVTRNRTIAIGLLALWIGICLGPVAICAGLAQADISFYQPAPTYPLATVSGERPKNVILFIGDGMGPTQLTTARIAAVGPNGRLWMDRMPVTGIVLTHSANSLVTDSAASATALACGSKTNNSMIGQDPNGPLLSILELARQRGLRTGLVVTKNITDATPAAFVAHVRHRNMESTIARQLVGSRMNVLFGGGKAYFIPRASKDSKRLDQRDLIQQARQAGYLYLENLAGLDHQSPDLVLGLFSMGAMITRPPEPSLSEMTEAAIRLLDRPSEPNDMGFFLMVEGSQIDTACHDNDLEGMVRQLLLFDMAVKTGLEFAIRDGSTLVLVTADHETGGLHIVPPPARSQRTGSDQDEVRADRLYVQWTSKAHTGSPVILFAYGPGAMRFTGLMDNTDLPKRACQLFGLGQLPQQSSQQRSR